MSPTKHGPEFVQVLPVNIGFDCVGGTPVPAGNERIAIT